MLCIDILNNCIIMYTKDKGQVVRLFYSYSNKDPVLKHLNIIKPYVCILRLYVNPPYRCFGHATLALKLLFEHLPDAKTFILTANPDDPEYMTHQELLNFYGKFGFKVIEEVDEGTKMIFKRK